VDWAGVAGYWRGAGSTFAATLAPTIRAARQLTGKPVLIGETGAPRTLSGLIPAGAGTCQQPPPGTCRRLPGRSSR
jgi:hypothetical protein